MGSTVAAVYENIIRNNPRDKKIGVLLQMFQIGSAPYFTFEVKSVTVPLLSGLVF